MNKQSSLIQVCLILLGFAIIGGGFVYFSEKYNELNAQKEKLESDNSVLENRIEVLSTETANLESYASITYRALPESNSTLFAANNLNTILSEPREGQVVVQGIRVSTSYEDTQELQTGELGFEVQGEANDIFDYLDTVFHSLPLLKLSTLETQIDESNLALSTASFLVYNRKLPTELPAITEALPTIEETDKQLISELESYYSGSLSSSPQSFDNTQNGAGFGRENPFSSIQE